eukprot:m.31980 g.31980  ORF g.31980 m.31980 type:complete len:164 (-) comp8368_c0_seq1:222-713(-)
MEEIDHDPTIAHVTIMLEKDNGVVGLQVTDSENPKAYPSISRIGRNTPAFDDPLIQLGDQVKAINYQWCRGKPRTFVHELVRKSGDTIRIELIKGFQKTDFQTDSSGLRKESVFRINPLVAMMNEMGSIGEDEEEEESLVVDSDKAPEPEFPGFVLDGETLEI